jgi:hypothetical protein
MNLEVPTVLQQGPPPIVQMDENTVRKACIVVLHNPRETPDGQTDWSLSLVDITGAAIARETVTEPATAQPLDDLAQPYLDLIGRTVRTEWISSPDDRGFPRHYARII